MYIRIYIYIYEPGPLIVRVDGIEKKTVIFSCKTSRPNHGSSFNKENEKAPICTKVARIS